jgi:hypothetical protein
VQVPDFPPDEFDQAAEERGPIGVHRKRKRVLWAIAAPLIIFVAAGALAYGVVVYLWRAQGNEGVPPLEDEPRPTITATVAATSDAPPSPTASPSPSASPSPTPTAEPVQFDTPVSVLNGAGIAGLAGKNQAKLESAGFTKAVAGNMTGAKPSTNTVRYADADLESTAQKVAEVLGISTIERGVVSGGDITVLLVTDPAA